MSETEDDELKDYLVVLRGSCIVLHGSCIAPDLQEFISQSPEGKAFDEVGVSPAEVTLQGAEFIIRNTTKDKAYEVAKDKCEKLNDRLGDSLTEDFKIDRRSVMPVDG